MCRGSYEENFHQYLNLQTLIPHFFEEELIGLQSNIADEEQSISGRIDCLLDLLKEGGPESCDKFIQALEKEDEHLGHQYILHLMKGHKYANGDEIVLSSRLRERVGDSDITDQLLTKVNLETSLVGRMYSEKLLTGDELVMLRSCLTSAEKIRIILRILKTKGPLAYLKFLHCLKEDSERFNQVIHQELFRLVCNDESVEIMITSVCWETKAREDQMVSVTKRVPIRLEIEGELVTNEYLNVIQDIRLHHNKGEWDAVDKIVKGCEERSADFYVAVLLESCTGFIIRQCPDKVEETVKKAKELCSRITNNCNTFLRGRCEWTLAKLYRYMKKNDKALKHITMARHIQYNIEAGKDTALCNYYYGCILVDSLVNKSDPYKELEAKRSLELAIEHASRGDFGLDVAHPKIRLAQLYLGSSPRSPGTKTDDNSLSKAQSSLESVGQNLQDLAIRTRCIYYYTESDLHRNSGEPNKAIHSAQKALDIAKKNKFSTEIELITKRLKSLVTA